MIDLSRAHRNTDPANLKDIPGPGYYSSPSPRQVGSYVFGRSERAVSDFSSNKYEDIPGPGAYSVNTMSTWVSARTPFNSSSVRFPSLENPWKPGPGSYHKNQAIEKAKQKIVQTLSIHPSPVPVSIPLLERHELAIYDGCETKVSPAEYYPKIDQIKPRNPASLFSKSKMQRAMGKHSISENIGPGSYFNEAQGEEKIARQLSLEVRFKEKKNNSPGPGSYNPNIDIAKPSPQKFIISKLERNFHIAKKIVQDVPMKKTKKSPERINPHAVFASNSLRDCNKFLAPSPVGPGKYELSPTRIEGYKFNAEPRFREKEETPVGPGTYDPPELPTRSSPVHLKTKRFKGLSDLYVHALGNTSLPGPGDYEVQGSSRKKYKGLSFELSCGRTERKRDHSPDPGQYYTDTEVSGGYKIPADNRFKPGVGSYLQNGSSSEFVGPGSYKHKVSMVKRTHNISWI